MTWEKIAGLIRMLLGIGGGYVVGAGVMEQAEADAAIAALMVVIGSVWSVMSKPKKKEG